MSVRLGVSVLAACAIATSLVAALPQARRGGTAPAAGAPAARTWPPDASTLAARRVGAENRALFRSRDTLPVTLTADFKAITRDRNPESTRTFPGTISYTDDKGATVSRDIRLRNRGHSRRDVTRCDFPPIRLEFDKAAIVGTLWEGHGGLKLGTHCREVNEYEQYVLREHTVYRIHNLITAESFRTRLAKVTYIDPGTKKASKPRYGLFIEDDDDVAERMDGRIIDDMDITWAMIQPDSATWLGLFEYMIGNTDMSVVAQHNVRSVETAAGTKRIVPYDFDYSGLVNTTYAVPFAGLNLASVRDRLYRGPCRTAEELAPYFTRLRELKPQISALYDDLPDMSPSYRKSARGYLEEFYTMIDRPAEVKKNIIDGCKKLGM